MVVVEMWLLGLLRLGGDPPAAVMDHWLLISSAANVGCLLLSGSRGLRRTAVIVVIDGAVRFWLLMCLLQLRRLLDLDWVYFRLRWLLLSCYLAWGLFVRVLTRVALTTGISKLLLLLSLQALLSLSFGRSFG